MCLDTGANLLGEIRPSTAIGKARDHQEFLATPADDVVRRAKQPAQNIRHLHEHGVSGGVAVGVVDLLEMIDVEQDEEQIGASRSALAARMEPDDGGGVRVDGLLDEAPIAQSGQRIGKAGILDARIRVAQLRRALFDQRFELAAALFDATHAQAMGGVANETDRAITPIWNAGVW